MTKWLRNIPALAVAMAGAGIIGAAPADAKVEGDTITLGSAISITGKYSTNGIHASNGYDLAVKRINELKASDSDLAEDIDLLRRMLETNRITSALFYGPPGTGKTTLAMVIAASTDARFEHVKNTIEPALAEGRWVITDRFADSSVAYQGYGHDLGREAMDRLHEMVFGDFQPDLTIILDIPVDQGLARAGQRRDGEDRYERMGVEFHERLRDGFLDIARRNLKRCTVIDATEDKNTIHKWIRTIVYNRLGVVLK